MHVLHPGIIILLSLLLLSRCSVRFQLLPRNSRLIRTICVRHLPKMSCVGLGDVIPNLEADSTHGRIRLHDWIGNDWAIIFSHPGDYTPVCTTELGKIAQYEPEFTKRGAKLLGLSTDTVEDHLGWIKDIESYYKTKINYPILADPDRSITVQLNMLDKDNKDPKTGKPLASRALHIVGPDKKLKLSFLYPGSTGRNFDEVVRVLDSLQLAAKKKVATPANWKQGEDVVVSNSLDNEAAKKEFPQGFKTADMPSGKDYLRTVKLS